jgi:dihydroorotate dehydrogenase (fumarate)
MTLTTTYMGLELRTPLVASSSPLSNTVDGIRRLADAGAGAVVLPSLFEEQVRRQVHWDAAYTVGVEDSFHETLGFFPSVALRDAGPRRYLKLLELAAGSVDVPVIASLNGVTPHGWTRFATAMEAAGAAAIELNIYYLPGDPQTSGRAVEQLHVDVLELVRAAVSVPVAVKLGPQLSSTGEVALRLDAAGADALVLFNRSLYPDIDPEALEVISDVVLSSPSEARLPRMWIALLRGAVRASLAATTGVERAEDIAAFLLAGADVVMVASALLRHGPDYAAVLLDGLQDWMSRHRFESVTAFRGLLAVQRDADPGASRRDGYVRAMRQANVRTGGPWSG